jgi:starch synthase
MIGKILFCSSEVAPYAKTGGLADVAGALPSALRSKGIDCESVMPYYGSIKDKGIKPEHVTDLLFPMGYGLATAGIYRHEHVFFIENDEHFLRSSLYTYQNNDFPDNLERFAFFSRACVELACYLSADILHINDWQTALVSAYLKALEIKGISTLFTIHNLAYQGNFDTSLWPLLLLPRDYYSPWCMEYFGRINIMKAGIVLSDAVSTVSRSYAREIQTPEFGVGLDGLLRSVSERLYGITNGIDIDEWNPATDRLLPANFHTGDMVGKKKCKSELKKHFGLEEKVDAPVFGLVSRLVSQKGIDLVAEVIPEIAGNAHMVILGSGEEWLQNRLRSLASSYPGRIGLHIGFSESLAHLIEAGSDFFLMPSRFEPCGLNQLISLRYGTIPIVTNVGGLADTVAGVGENSLPNGIRVTFPDYASLLGAAAYAIEIYKSSRPFLEEMIGNSMKTNVSWDSPANEYFELYKKIKGI